MKFSIVTPVFNGKKYISETIESVLSQEGDFEIEYIIVDGKSTDNTLTIIKKYEILLAEKKYPIKCNKLTYAWISEKDNGMYDAINKGFIKATGDVYAYINSDDVYEPEAFATIAKVLQRYPDIEWLKGNNSFIDATSQITETWPCFIYNQMWIESGIYGRNAPFIPQESVFWMASLWKKAGPINESLRLAGDYYLWLQFAKHAPLWSIDKRIARFRILETQLSNRFMGEYRREQLMLSKPKGLLNAIVKLFFWLKSLTPESWNKLFLFTYPIIFMTRNKQYIDFDENNVPVKKKAHSFIA
ncbi:MAG: glycosyltransferase family 2 protein [Patescibacteria group bacterium]